MENPIEVSQLSHAANVREQLRLRVAPFAREYDTLFQSSEGTFLANRIHSLFTLRLKSWLINHVISEYSNIPETSWSSSECFASQITAINDVALFQSFESAQFAFERRYIPNQESFLNWIVKLNLGEEAFESGLRYCGLKYVNRDLEIRYGNFALSIANAYPYCPGATERIRRSVDLLALWVQSDTAFVFNDLLVASDYAARMRSAQRIALNQVGGTASSFTQSIAQMLGMIVIDCDEGQLILNSKEYGVLPLIWSEDQEQIALSICRKLSEDHVTSFLTYEELESYLFECKGFGQSHLSGPAHTNPLFR